MEIINLTQHPATPDQMAAGVGHLISKEWEKVKVALSFNDLPDREDLLIRAGNIAAIAAKTGLKKAMIGGAPWLMPYLERALLAVDIQPLYAFSVRESREIRLPNGAVEKTAVFKHLGFVEV